MLGRKRIIIGLGLATTAEGKNVLTTATPSNASRRHALPAQSTPFIGREEELSEIARRLADPGCRLLTLVGPGGIGKTRLAVQAAGQQLDHFEHGVYFVSLVGVTSSESIVPSIAETIDISFFPGSDPNEQLLNYLSTRKMLLVLDNFDHLLAYTSLVTDILRIAPGVKILVTSRERLNVQEETLFVVHGLTYPDPGCTPLGASARAIPASSVVGVWPAPPLAIAHNKPTAPCIPARRSRQPAAPPPAASVPTARYQSQSPSVGPARPRCRSS